LHSHPTALTVSRRFNLSTAFIAARRSSIDRTAANMTRSDMTSEVKGQRVSLSVIRSRAALIKRQWHHFLFVWKLQRRLSPLTLILSFPLWYIHESIVWTRWPTCYEIIPPIITYKIIRPFVGQLLVWLFVVCICK